MLIDHFIPDHSCMSGVMDELVYEHKGEDLLQISAPTKCFALYQEPPQFIVFPALVAQHHMWDKQVGL